MDPLISVIIPCYNVEAYVERAVHSMLAQRYKNFELLLVDDASTDNTLQLLKGFNDSRISVISMPVNTQKIGAVNQALRQTRGDFIAFQDADDWSDERRLEVQLSTLQQDPQLGICFTNYTTGQHGDLVTRPAIVHEELLKEFHGFGRQGIAVNKPTCCPSMMISRQAYEKTKGYHPYFKGRVAEDIQWIYRILKYYKGACTPEILYHYTIRESSLTGIQLKGDNAKAAYSWQLLARLIELDLEQNIDALEDEQLMQQIELQACEQALCEQIKLNRLTTENFRKSHSYRLGDLMLKPFRFISAAFRMVK